MIETGTRELLDSLPEPAFILTLDGHIQHANPPARRLLDSPAAGRSLQDFLATPPQRLTAQLAVWAANGQPVPGRLRFRLAGGQAPADVR